MAPSGRSPALLARAEKLVAILEIASVKALDRHGKKFLKIATSKKLRRYFERVDSLPDPLFAQFLDLLEEGMPEEFRHMLK